ncbi:MAG: UMP kinase [Candidatus Methanomethylophilaceae archaeon]|nr:UMP kinase [Candidatus Methanomethylophilaceae archaeon]
MVLLERVVISVGGSVLIPENNDSEYICALADVLRRCAETVDIAVVCGGGRIARYYAGIGRSLGGTEYQLDELGIAITRVNAGLLSIALGDASAGVAASPKECADKAGGGAVAVMGGTEPGHTTDAVAAMIAREMGADRIINASNVDAVYSEDPRENPDAERFGEMTISQLKEIVYEDHSACRSCVFDPLGVSMCMEDCRDIYMVNGRDLEELENAILGRPIKGTRVNGS